jgi:hypothetical protein
MSRRSRLRTFAARASLTMLIALVVVWVASVWVRAYCPITRRAAVSVAHGQFGLLLEVRGGISHRPQIEMVPLASGALFFRFSRDASAYHSFTNIPLWAFAAPLAMATALLWRSELAARRLAHPELCPRCGYNNAATPTGAPCPECGTTTSKVPPTPAA